MKKFEASHAKTDEDFQNALFAHAAVKAVVHACKVTNSAVSRIELLQRLGKMEQHAINTDSQYPSITKRTEWRRRRVDRLLQEIVTSTSRAAHAVVKIFPDPCYATEVRADFDRLLQLANNESWTDETPVPVKTFGPLWPKGPPPEIKFAGWK